MMNLSKQVQYSQKTGESFTLNSLPQEVTVYSNPLLKVNDYLWILYDPQDRQVMRGDGDSFSLGEFGTFARQGYGRYVLRHIHYSNDNVVGYSDFTFAVLDPSKTQDVPIGIDNTSIQEEVYEKYEKGEYYGMKLTHSLGTKSGNPVQDNIILSERVVVLSDDLTDESGETHSLGEDIFQVNGYEIDDMIATPLNRSAISNKNLPLKSIEHQSFYYKDLGVLNGSWVYVCTIKITVELTTDSVVVTTVNGQSVRQKWKAK